MARDRSRRARPGLGLGATGHQNGGTGANVLWWSGRVHLTRVYPIRIWAFSSQTGGLFSGQSLLLDIINTSTFNILPIYLIYISLFYISYSRVKVIT